MCACVKIIGYLYMSGIGMYVCMQVMVSGCMCVRV